MKSSAAIILLLVAVACATASVGAVGEADLSNTGRAPLSLILNKLIHATVEKPNQTQCPYKGFDSVKNFDLAKYISAPWYVQKQIPITFQPPNTLYCVRAEYIPIDPANPLKAVTVRNYSNRDKVNGEATGTSGAGGPSSFPGRFIANVPNPQDPSKLNVGFALGESTTPVMGAPYWVVAIDEEDYQWAIITGGAPTMVSGEGKCITDGGFWLFSRKPVDPENTAKMLQVAEGLGLDTSKLLDVPQEGCLYEGA